MSRRKDKRRKSLCCRNLYDHEDRYPVCPKVSYIP